MTSWFSLFIQKLIVNWSTKLQAVLNVVHGCCLLRFYQSGLSCDNRHHETYASLVDLKVKHISPRVFNIPQFIYCFML